MTIDHTLIAKIFRSGITKFAVATVFGFVFLISPIATSAAATEMVDVKLTIDAKALIDENSNICHYDDQNAWKVILEKTAGTGDGTLHNLLFVTSTDGILTFRYNTKTDDASDSWQVKATNICPADTNVMWSSTPGTLWTPSAFKLDRFEGGALSWVGITGQVERPNPDKYKTGSITGTLKSYKLAGKTNYRIEDGSKTLPLGTRFADTQWSGTSAKVGNKYSCTYSGVPTNSTTSTNRVCTKTVTSTPAATTGPSGVTFHLLKDANGCSETEALTCWIAAVFNWSQGAILILATVAFVIAGIIYMTSAGNTKQIELSKKIMFGALSGVATIILGKFFLTVVVGVPWVN